MTQCLYRTGLAALIGAVAMLSHIAPSRAYPIGDEFRVHTHVDDPGTAADDDQRLADAAMDSEGNFVVVFQSHLPVDVATVAARRFNSGGQPQGAQFRVNTTGPNDNVFPKVAMDADGNFVVVWVDNFADGNSDGIMAQRYDAAGQAQGGNIPVNTTTPGQQHRVDIAMNAVGAFVIVWEDNPFGGLSRAIRGQYFDSDGNPQGGELEISTDAGIDHTWPRVAMSAEGDFVVTWESGDVGANTDLAVRRYDAAGHPLGDPVLINGTTKVAHASGVHSQTAVAADSDGRHAVIWRADNFSGPGLPGVAVGLLGRYFDADGTPLGDPFEVDTEHAAQLNRPDAAMTPDGRLVVAYEAQDASLLGVRVQRYYAGGDPMGAPIEVNTFTPLAQIRPAVAVDTHANAVVTWESGRQDEVGDGVFAQRLSGRGVQPAMDFNNDFYADIPWRHGVNGANNLWQMNGLAVTAAQAIPRVEDPLWVIAGIGDFDRDGNADLLWRNGGLGNNTIWFMDGFSVERATPIPAVPDLNWQVAGTGDFNRDGKSDVVWRHGLTGNVVIWLMDGSNPVGAGSVGVPGREWDVVGLDDFDADGRTDIVLRHVSGRNALWLMDGWVIRDGGPIQELPDPNWRLGGTGDFDANGKADMLWRHGVTGNNVIWLMNVFSIEAGGQILPLVDPNWKVEGVRDFDRNVKADILWRHAVNGSNAIWLIDGSRVVDGGAIGAVPDSGWHTAP